MHAARRLRLRPTDPTDPTAGAGRDAPADDTPGATVTWTNDDGLPHTVSFGDAGPASSDTIDPGGAFEATFDEAPSTGQSSS